MSTKKILVAGASGLVGHAAVQHFASLSGWEVVGLSRRIPEDLAGATLLSVDLADAFQLVHAQQVEHPVDLVESLDAAHHEIGTAGDRDEAGVLLQPAERVRKIHAFGSGQSARRMPS